MAGASTRPNSKQLLFRVMIEGCVRAGARCLSQPPSGQAENRPIGPATRPIPKFTSRAPNISCAKRPGHKGLGSNWRTRRTRNTSCALCPGRKGTQGPDRDEIPLPSPTHAFCASPEKKIESSCFPLGGILPQTDTRVMSTRGDSASLTAWTPEIYQMDSPQHAQSRRMLCLTCGRGLSRRICCWF